MRLFVAVQFTDAVREGIQSALVRFPVADPPWRWSEPGAWHITLRFLGPTDPAAVAPLAETLAGVARRHASFRIALGAFGAFPNVRNPRVLFYRISRGGDALGALSGDIDAALASTHGLPLERKAFHAHATVARIKKPLDRSIVEALESVPGLSGAVQTVKSFELVRSHLGPSGARYEPLKQFALPEKP